MRYAKITTGVRRWTILVNLVVVIMSVRLRYSAVTKPENVNATKTMWEINAIGVNLDTVMWKITVQHVIVMQPVRSARAVMKFPDSARVKKV